MLRTEKNPCRNLVLPEEDEEAMDGQDSPEPVLRGNQMELSEGEGKANYFKKWLAQIRETKARLSLSIEGNSKRIADNKVAGIKDLTATLLDEIKQWKKEALENSKKCDTAYSEATTVSSLVSSGANSHVMWLS